MRRDTDRSVTAVIEGMSDAFLAIGPPPEWRITYANRQALEFFGRSREELEGIQFPDLFRGFPEQHPR